MSEEGDMASLQARKRRMERRAKQGHVSATAEDASDHDGPARKKPKGLSKDVLAKIPGVKKQARYVPVVDGSQPVNMSKEELTLWRKEARRVRNRESAAASRQKTQGRITELEAQVATLTSKYQAALAHISELEGLGSSAASVSSDNSSSQGSLAPASAASAWMPAKMSLDRAAAAQAAALPTTVSPPLSPRDSCGSGSDCDSLSQQQPLHWRLDNPQDQDAPSLSVPLSHYPYHSDSNVGSSSTSITKYQQRPFKISRPNACVKNPFPRAVVTAI